MSFGSGSNGINFKIELNTSVSPDIGVLFTLLKTFIYSPWVYWGFNDRFLLKSIAILVCAKILELPLSGFIAIF